MSITEELNELERRISRLERSKSGNDSTELALIRKRIDSLKALDDLYVL